MFKFETDTIGLGSYVREHRYVKAYMAGYRKALEKGYERYYLEAFAEGYVEGFIGSATKTIEKLLRKGIRLEEISEYTVHDSCIEQYCLAKALEIYAAEHRTIEANNQLLDQT